MTSTINLMHQYDALDPTSSEPAVGIAGLTTIIPAVLILVNIIWKDSISPEMSAGILGIAAAVMPLITALLIRRKVWSPASVVKVVEGTIDKVTPLGDSR